jgi:hypothetical protein
LIIPGTSTWLRIFHQAVAATVRGMKTSAPSLKRAQSSCTCSKVSFRWPLAKPAKMIAKGAFHVFTKCEVTKRLDLGLFVQWMSSEFGK